MKHDKRSLRVDYFSEWPSLSLAGGLAGPFPGTSAGALTAGLPAALAGGGGVGGGGCRPASVPMLTVMLV